MTLAEVKECIERVEARLSQQPFVIAWTEARNGRLLHVALTERLRKRAHKGHVWKSPHMLSTLKNAEYGYDESHARSRGSADGIFVLDRGFRPENEMMRKVFDRYLDHENSGAREVASALGADLEQLIAVRLVSHHMRLVGVLLRRGIEDWLVLIDYDDTE